MYLLAGCGLIVAGAVLPGRDDDRLNALRAFLFGGGLLTAGAAVALRLRTAPQDFESRIGTASLLLCAGFGVCLAYLGTPDRIVPGTALAGTIPEKEWDSVRLFLMVLGVVTVAGTGLVLLPVMARKVVVSVLILLHF